MSYPRTLGCLPMIERGSTKDGHWTTCSHVSSPLDYSISVRDEESGETVHLCKSCYALYRKFLYDKKCYEYKEKKQQKRFEEEMKLKREQFVEDIKLKREQFTEEMKEKKQQAEQMCIILKTLVARLDERELENMIISKTPEGKGAFPPTPTAATVTAASTTSTALVFGRTPAAITSGRTTVTSSAPVGLLFPKS